MNVKNGFGGNLEARFTFSNILDFYGWKIFSAAVTKLDNQRIIRQSRKGQAELTAQPNWTFTERRN